jgi:hypothetical protein
LVRAETKNHSNALRTRTTHHTAQQQHKKSRQRQRQSESVVALLCTFNGGLCLPFKAHIRSRWVSVQKRK